MCTFMVTEVTARKDASNSAQLCRRRGSRLSDCSCSYASTPARTRMLLSLHSHSSAHTTSPQHDHDAEDEEKKRLDEIWKIKLCIAVSFGVRSNKCVLAIRAAGRSDVGIIRNSSCWSKSWSAISSVAWLWLLTPTT